MPAIGIRRLGLQKYEPVWRAMQTFTNLRDAQTADEIWFTEHLPVFTQGLNGRHEHVLAPGDIPVVSIDRGGQVTYHGPGQLMVYPLLDLKRARLGIRELVTALEQAVIRLCAEVNITAESRCDAPGVYVAGAELASLGLRIRRGASYHGLALNVAMDLEPFSRVNPCGFTDLQMCDLAELGFAADLTEVQTRLQPLLIEELGLSGHALSRLPDTLPGKGAGFI